MDGMGYSHHGIFWGKNPSSSYKKKTWQMMSRTSAVKPLCGFVFILCETCCPTPRLLYFCQITLNNIIYPSVSILNERYLFLLHPYDTMGLTNQRSSSCISQDLESKPAKHTMFHHFQATRKNWNIKPQRVVPLSQLGKGMRTELTRMDPT